MEPKHKKRTGIELLALAIASLFGTGFFPKMPGTAGSAVALLLLLLPVSDIHLFLLVAGILGFLLGLVVVPELCDEHDADPGFVVIDEAAAMWLILASPLIEHTWLTVGLAFGLFRLFDIWKPFPIQLIERRKGSFAVMADDLVAAFYASVCLHLLYHLYNALPLVILFLRDKL